MCKQFPEMLLLCHDADKRGLIERDQKREEEKTKGRDKSKLGCQVREVLLVH